MSSYRIEGESGEWEMVVGLEIHAQVASHAKLFSDAPTDFGAGANTQVSLVDAATVSYTHLPLPTSDLV